MKEEPGRKIMFGGDMLTGRQGKKGGREWNVANESHA
jgi:hypothetical protein